MFLYRAKYAYSESDIQNNDLLYKIHKQCQNTLVFWEKWKMFDKNEK